MISLGTYQLFGDACCEAVELALALGYRSIDTAIGYQNEDAVGKAISESGVPRSQIRIQTKIPPDVIKLEEVGVEAAVKKSMEKLGVEYIDSVLLHWPGAAKIKAESQDHIPLRVKAWKTLEKLKSEGKIREIGVSNFLPRHLDSIVSNSSCGGVIDVIQMELHPLLSSARRIASSNKKKEQQQHQKTNVTRIEAYGPEAGKTFAYGSFPKLPSKDQHADLDEHSATATLKYLSLECPDNSTLEIFATRGILDELRAGNAADPRFSTGTSPDSSASHWTVSTDTSDEVVDGILDNLGTYMPLERRPQEGPNRRAWSVLITKICQGYAEASTLEDRDRILRRLLAAPRMFMRSYVGSISSRLRKRHAQMQLVGNVCTQTRAPDQNQDRSPKQLGYDEWIEKCLRDAFKKVREGALGRAMAALTRIQTYDTSSFEAKFEDLKNLHPKPDSPDHDAKDVSAPTTKHYSTTSFSMEDVAKSVKACSNDGSAPGPDGWTFEMLFDVMDESYEFRRDFQHMMVDILNGDVSDRTCAVLSASALIGIPKLPKGTRPIALGGTLLKVCGKTAVKACSVELNRHFAKTQFGVNAKGGADTIIHNVRRFIRDGTIPYREGARAGPERVVVCLDFANAFNTPYRAAMWKAVSKFPKLCGLYKVSYGQNANLFVRGGPPDAIISSARGARQGTVEGPAFFSIVLQQALDAANAVTGVRAMSYLDDISILAPTAAQAEEATQKIKDVAGSLGMSLKPQKCEILYAERPTVPQPEWLISQFNSTETIKLLGASISTTDELEKAHLLAREKDKTRLAFERLRPGCSPQFFRLLRDCMIPKLSHATRVHNAEVTRELCQIFDARVEELMEYWSCSKIGELQRFKMGLPRRKGGLGLTRMEVIAPAAYHASCTTALHGARKIHDQGHLCAAIYENLITDYEEQFPKLTQQLELSTLRGVDAALCCSHLTVDPDVMSCVFRIYLGTDAYTIRQNASSLPCPGEKCTQKELALGGEWSDHVTGCCKIKGGYITKRHNNLARLIRNSATIAGWMPDPNEPRDMASYTCGCGDTFTHAAFIQHRKQSGCTHAYSKALHISGPDIRYHHNSKTKVIDVTIICLSNTSHGKQTVEQAFDVSREKKNNSYGVLCREANADLIVGVASSSGHLGRELCSVADHLATDTFLDPNTIREKFSATIVIGTATARQHAEQLAGIAPPSINLEQTTLTNRLDFRKIQLTKEEEEVMARNSADNSNPQFRVSAFIADEHDDDFRLRRANGIPADFRARLPDLAKDVVKQCRDEIALGEAQQAEDNAPQQPATETPPNPDNLPSLHRQPINEREAEQLDAADFAHQMRRSAAAISAANEAESVAEGLERMTAEDRSNTTERLSILGNQMQRMQFEQQQNDRITESVAQDMREMEASESALYAREQELRQASETVFERNRQQVQVSLSRAADAKHALAQSTARVHQALTRRAESEASLQERRESVASTYQEERDKRNEDDYITAQSIAEINEGVEESMRQASTFRSACHRDPSCPSEAEKARHLSQQLVHAANDNSHHVTFVHPEEPPASFLGAPANSHRIEDTQRRDSAYRNRFSDSPLRDASKSATRAHSPDPTAAAASSSAQNRGLPVARQTRRRSDSQARRLQIMAARQKIYERCYSALSAAKSWVSEFVQNNNRQPCLDEFLNDGCSATEEATDVVNALDPLCKRFDELSASIGSGHDYPVTPHNFDGLLHGIFAPSPQRDSHSVAPAPSAGADTSTRSMPHPNLAPESHSRDGSSFLAEQDTNCQAGNVVTSRNPRFRGGRGSQTRIALLTSERSQMCKRCASALEEVKEWFDQYSRYHGRHPSMEDFLSAKCSALLEEVGSDVARQRYDELCASVELDCDYPVTPHSFKASVVNFFNLAARRVRHSVAPAPSSDATTSSRSMPQHNSVPESRSRDGSSFLAEHDKSLQAGNVETSSNTRLSANAAAFAPASHMPPASASTSSSRSSCAAERGRSLSNLH